MASVRDLVPFQPTANHSVARAFARKKTLGKQEGR